MDHLNSKLVQKQEPDEALERFSTVLNLRGFPSGVISDSESVLVKEASMDGSTFIDGLALPAFVGGGWRDELPCCSVPVWRCAFNGDPLSDSISMTEGARYRTTNWSSHNDVLRKRGSLLIWMEKGMA